MSAQPVTTVTAVSAAEQLAANNAQLEKEIKLQQLHALVPFSAVCCQISSFYCSFPDCIGCRGESEHCCVQSEFKCCKPSDIQGECCLCSFNRCAIITPRTLCKGVNQVCCCDTRFACPCDQDVPCMLTVLGLTCFYNWGFNCKCCNSIGAIKGEEAAPLNQSNAQGK